LHSGAPRLPRTDFYFGEETILACVDGAKTIESVRQLSRLSEMEFDRSLCALLLSGILHFGKEPKGLEKSSGEIPRPAKSSGEIARPAKSSGEIPRPDSQPRSPFATQPMPAKDPQPLKTLSEPEMRQLVFATIQKFEDSTDEEVLGVLPDSNLVEVNRAYDDLCSSFHAPFYSLDRFLDIKDPLKAILDRAAQAHSNLIAKITARTPLQEAHFESSEQSIEMESQDPTQTPTQAKLQKESISDLQEKVRKEPTNTTLLRHLGQRLYETGKPQESEKQYLKALELEPQSVENHLALAEFYTSMGLKIKAFKHLNIILQIQPNNERALEMLNLKKSSKKPLYEI
jgi:tetratricopeptide (TPR) repeat protein